jgi:hypothetical protein
LNRSIGSPLSAHCNAIFLEVLERGLSTQKQSIADLITPAMLDHFARNDSLDSLFYPFFVQIVASELARPPPADGVVVALVRRLIEEKRQLFAQARFSRLISHLVDHIKALNVDALWVLCRASQLSEEQFVVDAFVVLPQRIIHFACQNAPESRTLSNQRIQRAWRAEEALGDPKTFQMPPLDLVRSRVGVSELSNDVVSEFLTAFRNAIDQIGNLSAQCFVEAFACLREMVLNSACYFAVVPVVLQLLPHLVQKVKFGNVMPLLTSQLLFDPEETVFGRKGLLIYVNTLRNAVIDFCSTYDVNSLVGIFVQASAVPLLFAEVLLRNHWRGQPLLDRDFFAREPVMSALVAASLGIKEAVCDPAIPGLGYAKSIIFLTLFGLLDDRVTAQNCLNSSIFVTGFLMLMLEADFTSVVLKSLASCLSEIETLPEQVPVFLISVFEACVQRHTDEHMPQIACDLTQAIVRCLSHNIKFSLVFDQVLEPALLCLRTHPTAELFDGIFNLLMLVTEGQKKQDLSQKRFNLILDIIAEVEGAEPSQATFRQFLNMLNASTNLSMNLPFVIKVPEVIPLVLVAFSRSRQLPAVLAHFMDLCKHSVGNIIALHNGEATSLLLRAVEGSFEYRGRIVDFDFTTNRTFFIQTHIWPLVALILASRSSYEVDHTLRSLVTPDAQGVFSPHASLVIELIDLAFSLIDRNPFPQFPIATPTPIITFHAVDSSRISNGFVFAFHAQMDSLRTITSEKTRFILLELSSGPRHFIFLL